MGVSDPIYSQAEIVEFGNSSLAKVATPPPLNTGCCLLWGKLASLLFVIRQGLFPPPFCLGHSLLDLSLDPGHILLSLLFHKLGNLLCLFNFIRAISDNLGQVAFSSLLCRNSTLFGKRRIAMGRFCEGCPKANLFGMRCSIGKSSPAILEKRSTTEMLSDVLALFTSTVT
ncbi:hypothetical protein HG531_012584 [Fusarium graminearum]|nr:hypothetical protein HG531_012584 [Fusarium graminearum]